MQGNYGAGGYYHHTGDAPPLPEGPPPLPPHTEPSHRDASQTDWRVEQQPSNQAHSWGGYAHQPSSGEPANASWGQYYQQYGQASHSHCMTGQQGKYDSAQANWSSELAEPPPPPIPVGDPPWHAAEQSGWQEEPPLPPEPPSEQQPPAAGHGWDSQQGNPSQQYPTQSALGRSRWDQSNANPSHEGQQGGRSRWDRADHPASDEQPTPSHPPRDGRSDWGDPPAPSPPPPLDMGRSEPGRSRWDAQESAALQPQGTHAQQAGRSRWDEQEPASSHNAPPPMDAGSAAWHPPAAPSPPPPALPWQHQPPADSRDQGQEQQTKQEWGMGHQGYGGNPAPPPPEAPTPPDPATSTLPWQQPGIQASTRAEGVEGSEPLQVPPPPTGQVWQGENIASQTGLEHAASAEQQGSAYQQAWDPQWAAYQQQGYQGYQQQGYGAYNGYGAAYQDPSLPQATAHTQQAASAGQPGYPGGYAWHPSHQQDAWGVGQAGAMPTLSLPTKNEVDAEDIFKKPGRDHRPAKIAIILRGLPGSGKTHIAKKLRDVEVENGGEPPRIHALDDYFVTEVEKEVIEEQPGKKPKKRMETVMEYLYEQELEDSYRASILKAFSKTVEEGRFPFVILDAPNIQVEDFRPFYMAAQQVGYEVYVLKPLEKDPEVCFKRNVHQREQDTIADLAVLYEPTPNIYTQIHVESLFDLPRPKEEAIEEIDMEDGKEEEAKDEDAPPPQAKSRWASLDDEESQGEEEEEAPKKKRRKREAETEDCSPSKEVAREAKKATLTSILRKAGGVARSRGVRWADQVQPLEGSSSFGPSVQKLEEVHWLEGLGPTPDSQHNNPTSGSFAEMAEKERKTEKKSFRDILFGGAT